MQMERLNNKIALVSGAGSGIGLACALPWPEKAAASSSPAGAPTAWKRLPNRSTIRAVHVYP